MLRLGTSAACFAGRRPLHTESAVVKASEKQLAELHVGNSLTWLTAGSAKYQVGKKCALRAYISSELS